MNTATVHIYTEPMQPAIRYIDSHCDPPLTFVCPPHCLLLCHSCGKLRQARNCVVQVYYDGLSVWCAPGKGCKDPKVIKRAEQQLRKRRSDGQKRRWANARREEP